VKRTLVLIAVVALLGVLFTGQKRPDEKKEITAYIVKVIRDVNMKPPAADWQKAVPLSQLKSGYEVRTDKASLAMILFADQSKLILREKSVVTIKGEVEGKTILSRSVHMDRGDMIFNVKKAETEQFRFSSPISVASIRGTTGGLVTGGSADSLTILEGLADFTNSRSGQTGHVGSGQTGVADSSGGFNVHQANEESLNKIRNGQNGGAGDSLMGPNKEGIDFGYLKSRIGSPVRVDLSAFNGKASGASLFYRKQGEQSFTELVLAVTGQTAKGQLSGDHVRSPKLEFYLSVKMGDGSMKILPEDGQTKPESVSVEAVQHELRVPGQTGGLQKKILVIKWNE